MNLAWGKKVDAEFREEVEWISRNLGVDPNHLMAAMAFETGETFSPSIKNPGSSATGLIQFMEATAKAMHTTTAKLARMTAVEQLEYVHRYFEPYAEQLATLADVYMAILWPKAVGKLDSYILWTKDGSPKTYAANKGLDTNKDGVITKAEAASKVHAKLLKGMGAKYLYVDEKPDFSNVKGGSDTVPGP